MFVRERGKAVWGNGKPEHLNLSVPIVNTGSLYCRVLDSIICKIVIDWLRLCRSTRISEIYSSASVVQTSVNVTLGKLENSKKISQVLIYKLVRSTAM